MKAVRTWDPNGWSVFEGGTTEWHVLHGLKCRVNLGVIWVAAVILTGPRLWSCEEMMSGSFDFAFKDSQFLRSGIAGDAAGVTRPPLSNTFARRDPVQRLSAFIPVRVLPDNGDL